MLKKNSFFFGILFYSSFCLCSQIGYENLAFITNQESDRVDIVDLKKQIKLSEINVGSSPAAIDIDQENKIVFISNPDSHNIFVYDIINERKYFVNAGKTPMGIALSSDNKKIYVTNWYDNQLTLIDYKRNKLINKIMVGNSPAGLTVDKKNKRIFVANREDNTITVLDEKNLKKIGNIEVENAPFGVFSFLNNENIIVTNVQSNSVSVIDSKTLKLKKNIKVGKWPYQAAIDKEKNIALISNQRENSISIIDMLKLKKVRTITDICEYPEGININYKQNLIVVACWFEDNIILMNRDNYSIIKKIEMSGGPRAFGNFILE